ncbi:MAG: GspH/FimT family pseudopilin [Thiohalomonadaceae bacterium]
MSVIGNDKSALWFWLRTHPLRSFFINRSSARQAICRSCVNQLPKVNRTSLGQSGFTLVELIVALAIMGVLLVAAPLAFMQVRPTLQYHSTVRELTTALAAARHQASMTGQAVPFVIDLKERRYGVGEKLDHKLPDELRIDVIIANSEVRDGLGMIRYYPSGGATGGSLDLRRPSGEGVRLRVDWLLGRTTQEELPK